jgi:hypothetical protein
VITGQQTPLDRARAALERRLGVAAYDARGTRPVRALSS